MSLAQGSISTTKSNMDGKRAGHVYMLPRGVAPSSLDLRASRWNKTKVDPTRKINAKHEIALASIQMALDDRVVETAATVSMELSPRPRLTLEVDFPTDEIASVIEIRRKGDVTFRLDGGTSVEASVGDRWSLCGGNVAIVLIPKTEPVTVLKGTASPIVARFSIINFPSMFDPADFQGNDVSSAVIQRADLTAGPWSIEMVADDSLLTIHDALIRRGGSAVTHECKAARTDGRPFSVGELDDLLEVLHSFLSFARGSYCGLHRVVAEDGGGNRVHEQWGTREVEPWRRRLRSWVDDSSRHALVPAFEGFWDLFHRPGARDVVTKALNRYLRSNESGEPEVSVVLTQAALEILANHVIPTSARIRNKGDRIACALEQMGIGSAMPQECVELNLIERRRVWSHGPHALVDIRNDLVHPDSRKGVISGAALAEARDLGLHYVELMLLQLAGYRGEYANRMKPAYKCVEPVPWATTRTT